ncbi:MAG: glycosyltransferase family 9 protein [Alphaproteobacteria bacterium]|nr:glycosyltransferase family 9 protein [Alphaproteobacteria bacterium]
MRLLFITATRIGDAVLTTGLLDHLCRAYPGIRVTVACGALTAPLFRSVPGLERVIVLDKRRWGLHWLRLWSRVVDKRWDIVVDLRRTALPQFLRKNRHYRAPKPLAGRHRVVELAAAIGAAEPPAPRLWLSAEDCGKAQALVDGAGLVLAVGPAANWRGKQWRAERFAALVARLTAPGGILPGARVAVFAGAGEREQATAVLQSVPSDRRIDLVGQVDLPVAAACLERCALFVGNDSGLMHLAAASGVPTLGLFGPSPDARYAPWGPRTSVVRTRESYRELVEAPEFDHRTTGTLMDGLSVDMAASAAEALWHRVLGVAA